MNEEEQTFHGFPENDDVKTTLQSKLNTINDTVRRLTGENQGQRYDSSSSVTSLPPISSARRPVNRFLKRTESTPSPILSLGNRETVVAKASKSIKPPLGSPTVQQQESLSKKQVTASATSSGSESSTSVTLLTTRPAPESSSIVFNSELPTVPVGKTTSPVFKRTNKFLKIKSPNSSKPSVNSHVQAPSDKAKIELCSLPQDNIVVSKLSNNRKQEDCLQVVNPNMIRMTESQPPEPTVEVGVVAVEMELEEPKVPIFTQLDEDIKISTNFLEADDPLVPVKGETDETICNENAKTDGKIKMEVPDQEYLKSDSAPAPKVSKEKKTSPVKPRLKQETRELSFLTSQSSRSKRTIVPNKRFFSEDTVQTSVSLKSTVQSFPSPAAQSLSSKALSTSEKTKSPSKKRFVSAGANTNSPKKRRKLSLDVLPVSSDFDHAENATVIPTISNSSSEVNGRPRRTIIPNRRFTDEPPKEMPVLTMNKLSTPEIKKKRKKSGKSDQISAEPVVPQVKVTNANGKQPPSLSTSESIKIIVVGKLETGANSIKSTVSASYEKKDVVAPQVEVNGNSSTVDSGLKDAKVETVGINGEVAQNSDEEIPMDESEVNSFKGNALYVGTCIVKSSDGKQEPEENEEGIGIICCGVCGQVKKYRLAHEKRKRGSFLCKDCVTVVNKIFQLALKAQAFSCIVGPPICEGWCPLAFTPKEQFCQACFAKTCLKNLPLKDDVYFKIWRSIPPMSRGCVPTAPVANSASPYVGKVVLVNEKNGEVIRASTSFKFLRPKKGAPTSGDNEDSLDSISDASIQTNEDLNSARIKVLARPGTDSSSNNSENIIPLQSTEESHLSSANSLTDKTKPNGVSKEEILLGRQTGQERVKNLLDPILKPDLDDVETFGFPVIIGGPSYPRKPLCFLCGSSGIEQLIYCSMCCEPYHPYCSGDELLLDTYIARCINNQEEVLKEDDSKVVVKWTCRRCISCSTCNQSIGKQELVRCSHCRSPFHLQTCIDKLILNKTKNLSKLKKVWTCDTCSKCKSCGKRIESNRRLRAIQEAAAAASDDEEDDDEDETGEIDRESENCPAPERSCLMLCLDCFKQRKKGSFCPICEVCYDDNDWDSKMIECSKCSRWIHSTCENLNDEQYNTLGRLPEDIEFVCRLCHTEPSTPFWLEAVQSHLIKECMSALRLFEQKALGSLRRKRSSVSVDGKPSFVCRLFADEHKEEDEIQDTSSREGCPENKSEDNPDNDNNSNTETEANKEHSPRPRSGMNADKSISYKQLTSCKVVLRDFVKYPENVKENLYALKVLGVEVLNASNLQEVDAEIEPPKTPICTTPMKSVSTPTKHVASIAGSIQNTIGSVRSLHTFQKSFYDEIENTCGSYEEMDSLSTLVDEAIKEIFPWFEKQVYVRSEVSRYNESDASTVVPDVDDNLTDCEVVEGDENERIATISTDPFKEVYWDAMDFFDNRPCILCGEVGDFPPELCGRLLWCGVNEWIHCNCAIWSSEVWEHDDGALQQVGAALSRGKMLRCKICNEKGATVSCCHQSCKNSYHFMCARNSDCFLLEDKTMFCSHHNLKPEQKEITQHDMKVGRKVYVDLEWIHKKGAKVSSDEVMVCIGSLRICSFGSIVPMSVEEMEWEDSRTTFLIPRDYKMQRVFWSVDNPLQKECYDFSSSVDSGGFPSESRVQDVGVNIVVEHGATDVSIQRGLEGIRKFHCWLNNAPKYIDEENVDWLPFCSEVFFYKEEEIADIKLEVDNFNKSSEGRESPFLLSVFSSGSCKKALSSSQLQNLSHKLESDAESGYTEGYASSVGSSSIAETPKSCRPTRIQKRRRSSFKVRRTPKRRCKVTSPANYESPRRRSMRNRYLQNDVDAAREVKVEKKTEQNEAKTYDDSDNDSGVIEGSSVAGSCDDEKAKCRVNLLSQFNESFERDTSPSLDQKEDICTSLVPISSNITCLQLEAMDVKIPTEPEPQVYTARLKFTGKQNQSAVMFESIRPRVLWMHVFDEVSKRREALDYGRLVIPSLDRSLCDEFLETASSLYALGICHRSVQYIIEQLPGFVEVVDRHQFKYSRRPYVSPDDINRPLPLNDCGSARCQGFIGRKPYDMMGWLSSRQRKVNMNCSVTEDTSSSRGQGLPFAMQFRDLGKRAKNRFVVARSEIHGRGLFSRCDVEKGEMLIEYAGEVIRPSLSDPRERYYESKGIGCYMFRIKTQVIDATMKGNAARFINHSCEPNCEAKTIRILGKDHIIIFALRKIFKGEELTYDYKFEREDDKIPCSCGAARCRRYMN